MTWDTIQQIFGRAIIDPAFRDQLLADPRKALEGKDLTFEEEAILCDIKATSLDEFARQLVRRMGRRHDDEL